MSGTVPSARRRVLKALGVLVLNVIIWIALPYYVGSLVAKQVPSTPLATPAFVYEFGAVIIALQVIIAITEGMAVSVPFISASHLFIAYYVWVATNGGNLRFNSAGTSIALGFQLLVYVLILPSIWGAIRAPIDFKVRMRALRGTLATGG